MSQPYASPSPLPGPSSHTYYSSPPPPQAPEFYHQYPASPQRGRSNHSQNRGRGRRQGPYAPAPHGRAYYPPPPPQPSHPYPQTAWHPQAYAHYAPPANYHPYPNHSYPLPESIPASSITTSPAPPVTSPLSSSRDLERPSSVAETNATSISIPSQPPQPTSSESIPVEQTPDELPKASEDRVEENALETHPDASFEDGENPGPLLIPECLPSLQKPILHSMSSREPFHHRRRSPRKRNRRNPNLCILRASRPQRLSPNLLPPKIPRAPPHRTNHLHPLSLNLLCIPLSPHLLYPLILHYPYHLRPSSRVLILLPRELPPPKNLGHHCSSQRTLRPLVLHLRGPTHFLYHPWSVTLVHLQRHQLLRQSSASIHKKC
ncbi:hypothetical protein SISNIDRAFT_12535 [Sistotremastrum niveocremeum HHB9708]|uniref:Uncharacterized protein n=1 Tax=Sistotremastrum niveocremeum HHB9708 TaxID=1314777 RepID=A0A165AJN9_9AGAM|nr:hypothetical protein SISNIDRAFT_12535 [Sistotremastrum niveocremeum HHB9708]